MIHRLFNYPKNKSFFIFGPRQTGKTTLIKSFIPSDTWKVNLLESDTYFTYHKNPEVFRKEAIKKLENNSKLTIFVDEIQKAPLLLNEVQLLMSDYPQCCFIMTGSSARKLKRGASNLLGGRALTRHLFPLTYHELKESFDLENILQYGSLPHLINLSDADKHDLLNAYTQTYLKEEIQAEALVRNLGGFARFLEVASSQCGEMVNYSAIGRDSALQTKTVQSYYEILEDTLIAMRLDPWRKSIRKRLTGHPKYYLFDTGITNAINGRSKIDPATRGHLFEQLVVLETYRLLTYKQSSLKIFYWQTNVGQEVDLVIVDADKIIAGVEIKSSAQISRSQYTGLFALKKDYPEAKLMVVTPQAHTYDQDGINIMGFRDYMEYLQQTLLL